jgi:hypothetical protein
MNKLEKDAIYDEISSVLSDFEEVDPGYTRPDDDVVYPMYEMLVKIQNCWDELIG